MTRALIAGATGFVGRRLVPALLEDGIAVRCAARSPSSAGELADAGCEVVEADLTTPGAIAEALDDVQIAYFLVHMMGSGDEYGDLERLAAADFASVAADAGVERLIYLGGLGEGSGSEHLRSRHASAAALQVMGPPLTHFRAGMVIGAGSESFELLRAIAERLPFIPAPDWLHSRTQPIGIRDVVAYLRAAPHVPESAGREIQIAGPDVLSHLELLDELARHLGRRPKRRLGMSAEIARPATIAAGAAAVTRGTPDVAAEISMGLAEPTVVDDPSGMELFDIEPEGLAITIARALEDAERLAEVA